jgi:putative ABC transport system permease protein
MDGIHRLETLSQDVRYGCRVLWRAKAFTVAAVATLALGIAGTTVMFALIQGVLLRPLPVLDQDRLILAWREAHPAGSARYPFGNTEIEAVAEASQLLENAAGVARNGVARSVLTDGGVSSYTNVALVTGGFFDVLGVQPHLGRGLTPADEKDGAEPVVVISHGLWQRHYGGGRDVIGRRVTLAEQPFTIIGVMPPDLDYPSGVEIWRLTSSLPTTGAFGDAARREVNLIGRVRPGVTIEQATSELTAINQRLAIEAPTNYIRSGLGLVVSPFTDIVIGDARGTMLALFVAVGVVLLIASANVANLLLMRGEARRGELALRVALGAGRARIVRQVLAESFILSVIAGIAGVVLAWWSLPVLMTLVPEGLPRVESIRIDQTVLWFAMLVVFVTALLAGVAPGLLSVRADLVSALRGGSTGRTTAIATRGRRSLVVAQVALAVIVLAAAGLLIRSVLNLQTIDLGMRADRLVLLNLHMPSAKYAERVARAQFLDDVIERLEEAPAIAAVTPVNVAPFTNQGWDVPRVTAEGQSADEAAGNPSLNLESIHPNYFATFEVPIVQGRAFTTADREGAVPTAIISEDVAAHLWPGEGAVGKRLKMGGPDSRGRWLEIIGVAAATRYRTVTTPRPTLYLPAAQFQMTATMLVARTTASPELLMSLSTERIQQIDRDVQVMRVAPFSEYLDRPLARPRFTAFLLSVFGLTALLLATVGLYAVMAAYVRQRDREIALRLVLGATATTVRRLVLSEALKLAGLGAVIGLICAVVTTRSLRSMLFGIDPLDPMTLVGAALILVGAAAMAASGPVRRAARADVVAVLRSE